MIGVGWPSKRLGGGPHGRVRVGEALYKRAGLLGQQAMRFEHVTGAPAAHRVVLDMHLGPQPTGAIPLLWYPNALRTAIYQISSAVGKFGQRCQTQYAARTTRST